MYTKLKKRKMSVSLRGTYWESEKCCMHRLDCCLGQRSYQHLYVVLILWWLWYMSYALRVLHFLWVKFPSVCNSSQMSCLLSILTLNFEIHTALNKIFWAVITSVDNQPKIHQSKSNSDFFIVHYCSLSNKRNKSLKGMMSWGKIEG